MNTYFLRNTQIKFCTKLQNSYGVPANNVAQGSLTAATLALPDGTTVALSVSNLTWTYISSGAFADAGIYLVTLQPAVLANEGEYTFCATYSTNTAVTSFSVWQIHEEGHMPNVLDARKMLTNKMIISNNECVIYDDNGTSVLRRFSVRNAAGIPTNTLIAQRIPI